MCLCVHAFWNTLLIGWGAFPPWRTLQQDSAVIGRSGARDAAPCIISSVHSSPGSAVHVSWGETAATDLVFFFPCSRFAFRHSWQVHVWVGHEREQSWLGLGNHALLPVNSRRFSGKWRQTHWNVYTNIQIKIRRRAVDFKWSKSMFAILNLHRPTLKWLILTRHTG